MNAREIVARLNELDEKLCTAFGISRSEVAMTLDEAIEMAATTTRRLLSGDRNVGVEATPRTGHGSFTEFLKAQVDARVLLGSHTSNVVRALTAGIRRMKKAGSLQGLGRQACIELCDGLAFDKALLSLVEDDVFLVEESDASLRGPTVIKRRGCVAERQCVRMRDAIRTNVDDAPPAPGYRELLGSADYLVAPVVADSMVVGLLHVSRHEGGVSARDIDLLGTFAAAYSLLHERMLNTERVQRQRTSIARAAARLTEEADRIAAAAISLDVEYDNRGEPPTIAPDSTLAAALSNRERQVFERLVLGASNAAIADELVITVETVKTHVKRILRKIGAINRSEAIALYMEARTGSLRHSG
ncbi:LuxR family transcriptional regulator [Mycobacterium barrassiae]|uniref:helix-turn-helix transcriptional regulator n=1 Tax=Mycobacterium barrassiae TaxID=319709 RepID=UPI002265EB2E|nr:LuxR C-terminal-related transcriptional regulator [Mycobacterium barrassiae]MCV7301288.1 LuxR family transcriptional regulator [Mycobacterium barrassiae]